MMTPEAKRWLSKTVRELRERLIQDLRGEVEGRYKWQLPLNQAELSEENRRQRLRLESWLNEQVRSGGRGLKEKDEPARERFLMSAVKLAGATLLNRLVVVRQMETLGLSRVKLVSGGWDSSDYKDFRSFFGASIRDEEGEGFPLLLRLVFEELAQDLPGLFGEVGVTGLIPVPTATLRHVIEALKARELSEEDRLGLWRDDTLLGWVYQFWNDPEREALDGKVENYQIATSTQCFTDRYIVEWLLQNSLGQLWFALCARNGWISRVEAEGTLEILEARRQEWRARRDSGEVSLEALMPIHNALEDRWKYWVPRPLSPSPDVPGSLRDTRLLDPACGSGHFLVIAFDLLAALYEEEAAHRGESWTPEQIATWILERNLHGIDIDTRAVQIAGAALWLKMKSYAPTACPERLNLVSSDFGLGRLTLGDPEVRAFVAAVEEETGIPARLVDDLVSALKDADHLGSLLRVDQVFQTAVASVQQGLFDSGDARAILTERLEGFVEEHSDDDEPGHRWRGQSLARSTEFLRLNREGVYDLVVGNPPYLNKSKMAELKYLERRYAEGKADLYSAFLLRGLELARPGGLSCLLTLRGWMFLGTFSNLRERLLRHHRLELLGDLDRGAFEEILDEVVSVCVSLFVKDGKSGDSVAVLPTPREDTTRDKGRTGRKKAALLAGVGRYDYHVDRLAVVPEMPLVYWWSDEFLAEYASWPRTGEVAPAKQGLITADNVRFLRTPWEIRGSDLGLFGPSNEGGAGDFQWVPYVKGAGGSAWAEPVSVCVRWHHNLLELKNLCRNGRIASRPQNCEHYFKLGVAFSLIGADFTARSHRYPSVFGDKGSSVFPDDIPNTLCLMNSAKAKYVMTSLNPTVSFQAGDVNRLPLFPIELAHEIVGQLDIAFTEHEQARETSVEFQKPGPSAWVYAQQWAQAAVDRPAETPLPPYEPVCQPPQPGDHVSYALGLALGRFPSDTEPLPHGILFLAERGDGLDHPAIEPLRRAWDEHPLSKLPLRDYLKNKFFSEDHLGRYEKRPIYFPLSSDKKNFVAYVSIHRWQADTLDALLAFYLQPELARLGGQLQDLAEARTKGERKEQAQAQAGYDRARGLISELESFIDTLRTVAERGAPPCDGKCKPREVDAPYRMDLDDGVMINSAGLWPLLVPQWKTPRDWWKELCDGDYDWAHLAMLYFPARVTAKCQEDPSLAVAHGCFWRYHPAKATEWELRLQDPAELGPDFRLDEVGSDELRAAFEARHPDKVRELRVAEEKRRAKKADKAAPSDQGELDFEENE